MSRIAWIVFSFLFIWGCKTSEKDVLPYYNDPSFTPLFLNASDADKKIIHRIGDFVFTDQQGEPFDAEQLNGKIHVANFFFTGCGSICPGMMQKLSVVQKAVMNEHIIFLSFSVTPWSDSVPRLKAYADLHNIDDQKWKLLTGKTSEIYYVARRFYYAEEALGFTKDSTNFLHTEHVLLIDANKRIRGIYNGTIQLDMNQLIKDIQLLQSASTGD
ncbi:MAG: SCO family protein [Bacteroidota bacterium]|jgi:protein SCO1/2